MKKYFLSITVLVCPALWTCRYIHRIGQVAETPLKGWNSYDCYDWWISEKEFKENVDYMAEHILEYGWEKKENCGQYNYS